MKPLDEEKKKKAMPIYKQRLAGYLMLCGFRLKGVEENTDGKDIFYFTKSERLHRCIQSYYGKKR